MVDLLRIASNFKLQGDPHSCKSYGTGHIHDTYLLEAGKNKRYILQSINTHVFQKPESVQDNIDRILTYLGESDQDSHGYRDFELLRTGEEQTMFADEAGNFWRCFTYIEGTLTHEKVENPEQAYEGGRSFGYFCTRLKDYDSRRLHITIPNFRDAEWRQKQLIYAELTNPGERLKRAQTDLKRIKKLAGIPEKFIRISGALPDRVVHNDTKITNVLFDVHSGKGISVIDLDTVMTGTLLTDFGDMVRSFTSIGEEDATSPELFNCREDLFEGLVSGYSEPVSVIIEDVEKANLLLGAKIAIYLQAARFLTDYLTGDKYYKTSYPEQNLSRTRNQLGLLESLLSKEELLSRILKKAF